MLSSFSSEIDKKYIKSLKGTNFMRPLKNPPRNDIMET